MSRDPDGFPFDPDPRHPDEWFLDPRVPSSAWEHRREAWLRNQYANDLDEGRSGMVLAWGCAALLVVLIAIVVAALIAAPRSGPIPTAPPPPSDAAGLVRALVVVPASASGSSQSGAPHQAPRPSDGIVGAVSVVGSDAPYPAAPRLSVSGAPSPVPTRSSLAGEPVPAHRS